MTHRKLVASSLGIALAFTSLTGCASSTHTCTPSDLKLSSETVARGSAITVSSPAAACEIQFTNEGIYSISILSNDDDGNRTPPVTAKADHHGSFTVRLLVPTNFPTGTARVSVQGAKLSCGTDESCPGYVAQVRITEG